MKIIILTLLAFIFLSTFAFAQFDSEGSLRKFLDNIGDTLIKTIGPGILVIGVCIGGIGMATGSEAGLRRGIYAIAGGAMIMMSRSVLQLIQKWTNFSSMNPF